MKKTFIVAVVVALVMTAANAQELQLSGGVDFGFGFYDVDNSFIGTINYPPIYTFLISEKTENAFFAPGISFTMRVFPEKPAGSLGVSGFFFRDRLLVVTNFAKEGTGTVQFPNAVLIPSGFPSGTIEIDEEGSIADGDFFILATDIGMGLSGKIPLSQRFSFLADIGANISVVGSRSDVEGTNYADTLSYIGFGMTAELALQINITKTMYLEMGLNTIMNFFSHQEGQVNIPFGSGYQTVKYEDTGKFDLVSASPYIHLGWRIGLKP